MIAMAYGDVYVAHIAMGANMTQTVKAFNEAAAHPGPSLIIAYSPCIAHGIDMAESDGPPEDGGRQRLLAPVPVRPGAGGITVTMPLHLDSRKPTVSFKDFAMTEARFSMLTRTNPVAADDLMSRGPAGHRRPLASLRADGRGGAHGPLRELDDSLENEEEG